MKKVEIETECGEETVFYVAQDVETVTIDGEEWVKKTDEEDEDDSQDETQHRKISTLGYFASITPVNNDLDNALTRIKTLSGCSLTYGSLLFIPTIKPHEL